MKEEVRTSARLEAVKVPIEGVLDLHTFSSREIPSLVREYLEACVKSGIYSVRIVHGKGRGILKRAVCSVLEQLPIVASFADAAPSAGGWGATLVELKREGDFGSAGWANILAKGAAAMGASLTPAQVALFRLHAMELMSWNRFASLTALTGPIEIAEKHFLDTLALPPFIPFGSRVLDIGSGGGFPGIPLKVIRPDLHLSLIDASRKKAHFLKHLIRTMGLDEIDARHIRAEALAKKGRASGNRYDVIVSKAAFKIVKLFDLALPLCHGSGRIVAMKGMDVASELASVKAKIEKAALTVNTRMYRLPHLAIQRTLVILHKVSGVPD